MKSYDYEACAYDGAVYCNQCLPEGVTTDSEGVSPIFADSEHDCYPVCDRCGAVHDYVSLTTEGILNECHRQNMEVFFVSSSEFSTAKDSGTWMEDSMNNNDVEWSDAESVKLEAESLEGWYYWCCFPGCLPEGDAVGPFKTELAAATDALSL